MLLSLLLRYTPDPGKEMLALLVHTCKVMEMDQKLLISLERHRFSFIKHLLYLL
jgi:hypothetical protein